MESHETLETEVQRKREAGDQIGYRASTTLGAVSGVLAVEDGAVISAVIDASVKDFTLPQHVQVQRDGEVLGTYTIEAPLQAVIPEVHRIELPANSIYEHPASEFSEEVFSSAPILASEKAEHAPPAKADVAVRSISDTSTAVKQQSVDFGGSDDGIDGHIVERSPGGRYVRFMEKLGSGASKDVYRAYDTHEGIEVAWNVVNLSGVPKNERNRIINEVLLLERLHHPNIISFHGSWVNRERQEVNFVTEILSSGTLKSFINKVQVIRWKIAKRWALQILQGLEYLHSQEPPVIHRDLKCENIFINGTSGDLRIGDLGLSTVHRNGRVLSVLGTPEFMAPDMYEEKPYDERVDIYAFGMCVLEIFTKEIPYSECSNPAQIYKKVTNGELPEVLSRLQSKHARDFIMLCLGYKNEEGNYVRPSASELLQHPFLLKRSNDDDEVVVDQPLQKRVIEESGEHSFSLPRHVPLTNSGDGIKLVSPPASVPVLQGRLPDAGNDEEGGDRFDEMPESETNMRRVKVLMGRGTELKEEDDETRISDIPSSDERAIPSAAPVVLPLHVLNPPPLQPQVAPVVPVQRLTPPPPTYLVAAAVIENESLTVRPYTDNILKLVVTLPIDGQTQNVQFDFHLVDDEPVQVAKEMVQELCIPPEAAFEISETIRKLAQAARSKQDNYAIRMQNSQVQLQGQPQPVSQEQVHLPLIDSRESSIGSATLSAMPEYMHGGGVQLAPSQTNVTAQDPLPPPRVPSNLFDPYNGVQLPTLGQVSEFATPAVIAQLPPVPRPQVQSDHIAGPILIQQPVFLAAQSATSTFPGDVQFPQRQVPLQDSAHVAEVQQRVAYPQVPSLHDYGNPLATSHGLPVRGEATTQGTTSMSQGLPMRGESSNQGTTSQTMLQTQLSADLGNQNSFQVLEPGMSLSAVVPVYPELAMGETRQDQMLYPSDSLSTMSTVQSASTQTMSTMAHVDVRHSTLVQSVDAKIEAASSFSYAVSEDAESDEDDAELEEEVRKLDEDFKKNLLRAKKVFDNRMDNLQRSQKEREAQHQKTLEKHEKERAEFEKRLALEAEQQAKRVEQLKREWDRRRETLAQHKKRNAPQNQNSRMNGVHSTGDGNVGVAIDPAAVSGSVQMAPLQATNDFSISTTHANCVDDPNTANDRKMSSMER